MLTTDREPRFLDLQYLADRIKWTIESQLHEQFTIFDVIEDMTPSFQDEEQVFYRLKIRTDDDGYVIVKAIQPENGSDWAVHIEEYNRGNKVTQDTKGLEHPMDLKRMGDRFKWDVENRVQRTFRIFDVVESDLKIKVDADGYVKVKISQEQPGSEWLVRVEEFDRGNEAIEENRKFSEEKHCGQTESIGTDMQDMADMVRREVENQVHQDFKIFQAIENELRIKIDSHEYVIVKVTIRGGGMDWLVEVETFDRGDRCFEGNQESGHQKMVVH